MLKESLRIISIWIIVLPFVAGFINFKGLNKDSRWIFLLVVAGLIPQILTFIINKETPTLNVSYNLYTLAEFLVLFFLFREKFNDSYSKRVLIISAATYIIIAFYILAKKGISEIFLNDLVCYNNVLYMVWILIYLKEQYNYSEADIYRRNPFAWYLLGFIIYAPGSVILFALYHYIRDVKSPLLQNLWIIQSICNILLYVFFAVGFFIRSQRNEN